MRVRGHSCGREGHTRARQSVLELLCNCYTGKIDIQIPRLVTIDTGWGIFSSQDKCYVVFRLDRHVPCWRPG